MANPSTPSPATAPTGAPSPELIFQDVAAQTDRELARLKVELEVDDAKVDTEHKEFQKVEEFFREKEGIKTITRAEIDKMKTAIHDGNQEIEGQLQLTDTGSIELNNSANTPPATPSTETPEPVEEVADDFLPALAINADLPDIPEYKNPKKKGGIVEMIINWLGTKGILGWFRKNIMGYNDIEEMTDIMTAMNNILSIKKESPVSSIINLSHLTEYDFRDILRKNNKLDFSDMRNVEAAFLGKHAKDPKLAPYHSIYKGIEDMAGKNSTLDASNYNPIQGFAELLSYSKKPEFRPEYPGEIMPVQPIVTTPETVRPTEEETEAQELRSAQEIDKEKTDATAALAREEAIPDNPDAINAARERLNSAEREVKESIDGLKKLLEEHLASMDVGLKNITEIKIPMARRALTEAESNLSRDPANTELQTKKTDAEKHLSILEKGAENIKNALADIRENLMKRFETPGVTTAMEAAQLSAEVKNKMDIAIGATETEVVKTEREKTEAEKEAEKEKEKIAKEKEKLFGIYKKIKESKEGYYEDLEEKFVYITDEKGNLFRYKFAPSLINTMRKAGTYLLDFFGDDSDLPRYMFVDDNKIQMLNQDNDWPDSEKQKSAWESRSARLQMKNDAPDTPDWYNS